MQLHPDIDHPDPTQCPICSQDYGEAMSDEDGIHFAAHCCLWRAIGHAERVRVAEKIERGATWREAMKGVSV